MWTFKSQAGANERCYQVTSWEMEDLMFMELDIIGAQPGCLAACVFFRFDYYFLIHRNWYMVLPAAIVIWEVSMWLHLCGIARAIERWSLNWIKQTWGIFAQGRPRQQDSKFEIWFPLSQSIIITPLFHKWRTWLMGDSNWGKDKDVSHRSVVQYHQAFVLHTTVLIHREQITNLMGKSHILWQTVLLQEVTCIQNVKG